MPHVWQIHFNIHEKLRPSGGARRDRINAGEVGHLLSWVEGRQKNQISPPQASPSSHSLPHQGITDKASQTFLMRLFAINHS